MFFEKYKILIYVGVGLMLLNLVFNTISNIKNINKEPTYTKEAVELMIKHSILKKEIEQYKITNQIIEQDNDRLKKSINADSVVIYTSSRAYRDSLRAELFK